MLSIIVVSYNTESILKKALTKVFNQKEYGDFEVIVVDNASSDDSCQMVTRDFPQVKLIQSPVNGGFAAGNNLGIRQAKGEYILLLNSDAYIFNDSLIESVAYMEDNPAVGIMGPQLVCEDGSPQPSAHKFPSLYLKFRVLSGIESRRPSYISYFDYFKAPDSVKPSPRKVDWVPGAYFMIRRELINQIGLLDDRFFMYYEEVDFCLRAKKAGWDVVFNPLISIIHLGGQSSYATGKKVSRTGRQLVDIRVNSEYDYFRKHSGLAVELTAALIEVGWKTLIWIKNNLLTDKDSAIKKDESKLAIGLVCKKIFREFAIQSKPA